MSRWGYWIKKSFNGNWRYCSKFCVACEGIIYSVLMRYQECCGSKKTPILSQGKVITLRAQLLQQVEKYVLLFNSSKTSIVEKRALCNKGQMLYQKYCFQLEVNPDVETVLEKLYNLKYS